MPFLFEKYIQAFQKFLNEEKKIYWFFGFLVIIVSLTRYLAHSELWSIFYSKYLFQPGNFQDSLYSKLLFHVSIFWIHWLPVGNMTHLVLARLVSALLACGILFTSLKLLHLKFSLKFSVIAISILFFNHLVFWELPQLKADLFGLLFLLLALYFFERSQKKWVVCFLALAFLSTPKTILFFPILLVYFCRNLNLTFTFSFRNKLWLIRSFFLLPILLYGVYLLFSVQWPTISLGNTYVLAFRYAKDLFTAGMSSKFNELYYYYPFHVLKYWLPTVVLVAGLFFYKQVLSISIKNLLILIVLGIYIFVLVLLYPLKHPYFLIPILFLISILSLFMVKFSSPEKMPRFKNIMVSVLAVHFAVNIFQVIRGTNRNHGISQYILLNRLDQIARQNPLATIADGTGALPRSNTLPLFFGQFDDQGNTHGERFLKNSIPDLIFFTSKMSMSGTAHSLITNDYVPIAPSIFTKRVPLPSDVFLDTGAIISDLKRNFTFPIHTVSFRLYESKNINSVLSATCASDFVTKNEWTISEFLRCPRVFFKDLPQNIQGENSQVYVVPWPSYERTWPQSLALQLNYKNN